MSQRKWSSSSSIVLFIGLLLTYTVMFHTRVQQSLSLKVRTSGAVRGPALPVLQIRSPKSQLETKCASVSRMTGWQTRGFGGLDRNIRVQSAGLAGATEEDAQLAEKKQKQGEIVDKIISMGEGGEGLDIYLRENLSFLDQDFWMVYMTRYDAAPTEDGKSQLQKLANTVMSMIEVLVQERRNDETMERMAIIDRLVEDFIQARDINRGALKEAVTASVDLLTQDNNFWSRVANRYNVAQTDEEKERVSQMARDVQEICSELAKQAGQSVGEANDSLQAIMAAGANENGEWFLPLNDDELVKMRKEIEEQDGCSEQTVILALAWMKRAIETEDKEVAMVVGVIQKVLHLITAVTLEKEKEFELPQDASFAKQLLYQTLQAREEKWNEILATFVAKRTVAGTELLAEVEDLLQKILFTIPAGSSKQRVMVEYVQELETRIKGAYGILSPTDEM